LLDHGANANVRDSEGKTPSDWIKMNTSHSFDLIKTPEGWKIKKYSLFKRDLGSRSEKEDTRRPVKKQ
jgi:hypothetical protein